VYGTGGVTMTYMAPATEHFSLTIAGAGAALTIIDGGNGSAALFIDTVDVEDSNAAGVTIRNLTVRNGSATSRSVVFVMTYHGAITIENCRFTANTSPSGGGAHLETGTAMIRVTASTFDSNTSRDGGGLYVETWDPGGSISILNNSFENNVATRDGGGLWVCNCVDAGPVEIRHNRFLGNSANNGAGLELNSDGPVGLHGNRFENNSATFEGGGARLLPFGNASSTITNNFFVRNTAGNPSGFRAEGGGLSVLVPASLKLTNNTFTLNSAIGTSMSLMETRATDLRFNSFTTTSATSAANAPRAHSDALPM
jgi:hypothetical protein